MSFSTTLFLLVAGATLLLPGCATSPMNQAEQTTPAEHIPGTGTADAQAPEAEREHDAPTEDAHAPGVEHDHDASTEDAATPPPEHDHGAKTEASPMSPAGHHHAAAAPHPHAAAAHHGPSKTAPAAGYHCPMHPEVRSDKPASCSKCGMKLVSDGE